MSAYNQKASCQNHNEVNYQQKSPKATSRLARVSRQSNTPAEFLVCIKCHQKFNPKMNLPNQIAIGDCSQNMSEYAKALNYINSCHSIINQMMKKQSKEPQYFCMPDVPNFMDLFRTFSNADQNLPCDTPPKSRKKETQNSAINTIQDETFPKDYYEQIASQESADDTDDPFKNEKLFVSQSVGTDNRKGKFEDIASTRGKYLELLPDMKESDGFNKNDYLSDTEDSDLELNIMQKTSVVAIQNKYKQRVSSAKEREKIIYEEMDSHDEDSRNKKQCKMQKQDCYLPPASNPKESPPSAQQRPKRNSSIPGRIKNTNSAVANNLNTPRNSTTAYTNVHGSSSVSANTNQVNQNPRKIKPRSASNSATEKVRNQPMSNMRKKGSMEVAGNYSDTVISVTNLANQRKMKQKNLTHPIGFGNNGELSQRELDKYAKELLGSGSASPRSNSPDSRIFSPKPTIKDKCEEKPKKQKSKTSACNTQNKLENKRKSGSVPDKHSNNSVQSPVVKSQPVSSQACQQNMQQQQISGKNRKNSYSQIHPHKTDSQQAEIKTNATPLRNSPKQQNLCANRQYSSTFSMTPFNSLTTSGLQSTTKSNLLYTSSCTQQTPIAMQLEDDAYAVQSRCRRVKSKIPQNEQKSREVLKARPDEICQQGGVNLIDNMPVTNNRHVGSNAAVGCGTNTNNKTTVKTQYSVMTKPNDFFVKRNVPAQNKKESNQNLHYEDAEELNIESDDIKTDSDIEEDHFDRMDEINIISEKSSKSNIEMKVVLSNLGLYADNGQALDRQAEMIMNEVKSTRAHDERNRPFREPRKSDVEDDERDEIVRIQENKLHNVYATESLTQLRRTLSEESSDIKSDNEDVFIQNKSCSMNMQTRNINYTCYQSNRYQT